jgi:hypothetical protein
MSINQGADAPPLAGANLVGSHLAAPGQGMSARDIRFSRGRYVTPWVGGVI